MIFLSILFNVFTSLFCGGSPLPQKPDPCEEAKNGAATATMFVRDSLYNAALANIKTAFALDKHEHCISFGKDDAGNIISSTLSGGGAISSKVPTITNAFADLHNHPNNIPPDAGDYYGLININKNNAGYKTRFVVTPGGTVYALLVTNIAAALAFTAKYPNQPPAFVGGPPGFPVAIVDESREMKYQHNCTDEMVLAFILEKYNTGVSLLKQHGDGGFKKIITTVTKNSSGLVYNVGDCP
jgi:hypothetical protein